MTFVVRSLYTATSTKIESRHLMILKLITQAISEDYVSEFEDYTATSTKIESSQLMILEIITHAISEDLVS